MWGAVKAVEYDPLPFPDGDRLVVIRMTTAESAQPQGATSLEYFAWRERSRTLDAMGASWSGQRLIGPGTDAIPADRLDAQAFTPGLFSLLGVQPARGRLFTDTTHPYSADALVVVLSHRLWQERYGAADIVGRRIRVDGAMRTVVGVLADDFRYQQDNVAFWIPLIFGPDAARNPDAARLLQVTARLRPGETAASAERELRDIEADLAVAFPDRFGGWTLRVTPLREHLYGQGRTALYTLVAAGALLLAIVCANLSGLLLVRATTRQHELWVRVALGATRLRVVRQLMTEGMLLAIGGGTLGVVVAAACLRGLTFVLPPFPGLPRLAELQLDAELLTLTFLLSLLAALAFSALPAFAAVRLALARRSQGHAASRDDRRTITLRNATVVAQIAIATVMLVGGGLLSKSFILMASRDLGVDTSRTLSFEYAMAPNDYARALRDDAAGRPTFEIADRGPDTLARIHRRLQSVPGVESVAGSSFPPINSFTVPRFPVTPLADDDGPADASAASATTVYFLVSPGYFAAMRTPILRGREFRTSDDRNAPPVAVVNETAARLLWAEVEAVGRRLVLDMGPGVPPVEIVGVVKDIPTRRREQTAEPIVYGTFLQTPAVFHGRGVTMFGRTTFVLRHTGDTTTVLAAARRAVMEIDPERPLVDVGVVERHLHAQIPELRNYVASVGAFAVMAMLLAAMGVYGVAAFTVAVRLRELCLRRALGAGPLDIVWLVAWRAVVLVVPGLALGLAVARGLARLVQSELWSVAPSDPATFAIAAALLAIAAAVACAGPLRRALSADPAAELRRE